MQEGVIIDTKIYRALHGRECLDMGEQTGKSICLSGSRADRHKTILCAGSVLYALSDEGEVYVWGSNKLHQVRNAWRKEEEKGKGNGICC